MSDRNNLPVPYMARSHAYYAAQGFDQAYRYAHHEDAPFAPLLKPLAECTVGVITTASTHYRASLEPREVNSGDVDPGPQRLYADDLSWDKEATHLEDLHSYFPLALLNIHVAKGTIGGVAPRFHCAPTEYSHRSTIEHDAPEIHMRLVEDGADVALLVPL